MTTNTPHARNNGVKIPEETAFGLIADLGLVGESSMIGGGIFYRRMGSSQCVLMKEIEGAGYEGVPSMAILGNVIPYIGGEEEKVETEPQKILGRFDGEKIVNADFSISASCHRVPVMDGHTEAVWVTMRDNPTPDEVKKAMLSFDPGLGDLPSSPKKALIVKDEPDRPQPRLDRGRGNGMAVSVGRIRSGIRFICMGHNTVRGAAGASILNAELLVKKGLL